MPTTTRTRTKSVNDFESVPTCAGNVDDQEYAEYLQRFNTVFQTLTSGKTLFTTDVNTNSSLFNHYLASLPREERQFHQCRSCEHFINHYGGLVTIDDEGHTHSAMWNETAAPTGYYKATTAKLKKLVESAKVTGVFLSDERTIGDPQTGVWRHLAVRLNPEAIYKYNPLQTVYQTIAGKKQDYLNVVVALEEYSIKNLEQAVALLESGQLSQSEKVLGGAKWLCDLKYAGNQVNPKPIARQNLIWKSVAIAPSGFCHPRSGMLGTLLDAIKDRQTLDQIKASWEDKMHPLQYQRAQVAPKAGNIAAAEKIVQKLNAEGALERRYLIFAELKPHVFWQPKHISTSVGNGTGIFSGITPKAPTSENDFGDTFRGKLSTSGVVSITWEKFQRTVLDKAQKIEVFTKVGLANYAVLVTAVHKDATPILQWDSELERNPVSWYLWNGGSKASQFGLRPGTWVECTAVTLKPSQWYPQTPCPNQGEGVIFVLKGAKETVNSGSALFPSILKSEFHEIRSTIEAFSNAGKIQDGANMSLYRDDVIGPLLSKGSQNGFGPIRVRVLASGIETTYDIDRWD